MKRLVFAGKPASSPSPISEDTQNVFFYDKKIEKYDFIINNKDLEELVRIGPLIGAEELPTIEQKPSTSTPVCDATLVKNEHDIKIKEAECEKQCSIDKTIDNCDLSIFKNNIYDNENIILNFYENNLLESSHPNFNDNYDSFIHFCKNAISLNRYTWNIVSILNANFCNHSKQYIKTNNETILLSGSKGGEVENHYFEDIPRRTFRKKKVKSPKYTYEIVKEQKPFRNVRKRGLLTSMNVNFKPGPLCKKPKLNESSYISSKEIELVHFPRVRLKITPRVGSQVDCKASSFLKYSRDSDGFIDKTWADFASSVVQTSFETGNAENNVFSFPIPYENNRSKILMRRDLDIVTKPIKNDVAQTSLISPASLNMDNELDFITNYKGKDDIENSVKCVLLDILRTLYVSDIQDRILSVDPDYINHENMKQVEHNETPVYSKNIKKGKKFPREFKNLNITIIDIDTESTKSQKCNKEFCKLGCICSSINKTYFLDEHCGLPECMFTCKCDFRHNSPNENEELEKMIHGSTSTIINSHQTNRFLSKEEKKFQHTIIRSKDKTIVLGSKRRDIRTPKRYDDNNIVDDEYEEKKKQASLANVKILVKKLPYLKSCLTWCMLHNVYRCFCSNFLKFSEIGSFTINGNKKKTNVICSKDESEFTNDLKTEFVQNVDDKKLNSLTQKSKRRKQNMSEIRNEESFIRISDVKSINENGACESKIINVNKTQEGKKTAYIRPSSGFPNGVNKIIKSPNFHKIVKINNRKKKIENFGTIIGSNSSNDNDKTNSSPSDNDAISDVNTGEIKILHTSITDKNEKKIPQIADIMKKNNDDEIKSDFSKLKIMTEFLSPSEKHKYICVSWSTLMGHFLLKKVFIWLTKEKPHRVIISLDRRILSSKWIEIMSAEKDLLEKYPAFVYDIVNNKARDNHLILAGNISIWEICRLVSNNAINLFKMKSIEKKSNIEKKLNIEKKSNIEEKPITTISSKRKVNETLQKTNRSLLKKALISEKIDNNKITSSNSQEPNIKSSTRKQWFKIYIGNDFSELEIPSKSFKATLSNILKSSEITKQGSISRIISNNMGSTFGIYALPDVEEFFLGPYSTTRNPDIHVTTCAPINKQVLKSWGIWLAPDNIHNESILRKLHFASEQSRQVMAKKPTTKILNVSPLNRIKVSKKIINCSNEVNQPNVTAKKLNNSSEHDSSVVCMESNEILVISDSE